jgi:hypothetical protein
MCPTPLAPAGGCSAVTAPVYQLRLSSGAELFVLLNHLKSQSFSSGDHPLRRRQATAVRAIYDGLRDDGADLIAVLGDFNKGPARDTPDEPPVTLEPLLGPGSPLVDAYRHPPSATRPFPA